MLQEKRRMQNLPTSLQEELIDIREGGKLIDKSQEESLHS